MLNESFQMKTPTNGSKIFLLHQFHPIFQSVWNLLECSPFLFVQRCVFLAPIFLPIVHPIFVLKNPNFMAFSPPKNQQVPGHSPPPWSHLQRFAAARAGAAGPARGAGYGGHRRENHVIHRVCLRWFDLSLAPNGEIPHHFWIVVFLFQSKLKLWKFLLKMCEMFLGTKEVMINHILIWSKACFFVAPHFLRKIVYSWVDHSFIVDMFFACDNMNNNADKSYKVMSCSNSLFWYHILVHSNVWGERGLLLNYSFWDGSANP